MYTEDKDYMTDQCQKCLKRKGGRNKTKEEKIANCLKKNKCPVVGPNSRIKPIQKQQIYWK